mmetsp:Transcript_3780/g.3228  ORF Transcript_3780/g.3228 Transcript_3780/m.3228 type:complete len:123 (-) Transcript_3780:409-777(-)
MMKVCPKLRGYGLDVFGVQGDENPLNHWIYDDDQQSAIFARKMRHFLNHHDGVHTLLMNRAEIGNYFIPDRYGSRNDSNVMMGDYSPPHVHHNWRYTDIYEESRRIREEKEDGQDSSEQKKH